MDYRLAVDGDNFEKRYWDLFIQDHFPSYEFFWKEFVVPLTNRPYNIHFKNNEELLKIGKSENNLKMAQLGYSIIRHLGRCYEIMIALRENLDIFEQWDNIFYFFTRLVGAHDNSFELFGRFNCPKGYSPFNEISSMNVREAWRSENGKPLENIRRYRNNLIHNPPLPSIPWRGQLCLPAIGTENKYFDWRKITSQSEKREEYKKDFIGTADITEWAWRETIKFLEIKLGELNKNF